MQRKLLFLLILCTTILVGCRDDQFPSIDQHQSFLASMNILEPSMTFYGESGELIAEWKFDKGYSGALIVNNHVLFYGHQLTEADIYELSSGKLVSTIKTGVGSTNAYYDLTYKRVFITNSVRNSVTSFDTQGNKLDECSLGEYPMSMTSNNGLLYVINYKDSKLSIVNIDTMDLHDEWTINESSNGILIVPEKNTVWIGGHGKGNKANRTVDILDLKSGELQHQLDVSIMPVGFSRSEDEIYIINHGSNELHATNLDGQALWNIEIGANPFTVANFNGNVVVAGFDDHKIYILNDQKLIKTIDTGSGPFQLLVREVS
ncbi:YncE family protein [Ureibacillus manganicus]|uniref:Surface antigen n=1 Tax=Ureibacillus manganicus DSM 26584 TaxID=1384049 RepID=A0A0A3IYU4_9BACL|nr:PQQ-binding-like beta-propeller repeat protein [Ureibacillus manganicus]KGR79992.1 hypothetical protein CD29_03270 [Ureibacillus manganicus DSM 26584]